jgi:hypothetical protein
MIEGRWFPYCGRMTRLAEMAEVSGGMIRIRGSLEIRRVALVTIGICQLVVPVRVARLTLNGYVRSGQNKFRCGMIE